MPLQRHQTSFLATGSGLTLFISIRSAHYTFGELAGVRLSFHLVNVCGGRGLSSPVWDHNAQTVHVAGVGGRHAATQDEHTEVTWL